MLLKEMEQSNNMIGSKYFDEFKKVEEKIMG